MKHLKFLYLILFILTIIPKETMSSWEDETYYYCHVTITDHLPFYGPGSSTWNFASVNTSWHCYYDDLGHYISESETACSGNGDQICPSAVHLIIINPNDYTLDQDFLDNSAASLEGYMMDQVFNNNNMSGYQSYNTYYHNTTIYRNISWEANNSIGSLDYSINIFPLQEVR